MCKNNGKYIIVGEMNRLRNHLKVNFLSVLEYFCDENIDVHIFCQIFFPLLRLNF